MPVPIEELLDRIAEALIEHDGIDTADVTDNQKFILNGQLQSGAGGDVLALFQKDIEANVEDNLQTAADQIDDSVGFNIYILGQNENVTITIVGGGLPDGGLPITDLVIGDGNPLNLSQFIPIENKESIVDIERAEEFLDTNIYELLPSGDTRQSRIIRLFQELNALLPPTPPDFDVNPQDGIVDRDEFGNWINAEQYSQDNSISYTQDNSDESNIDEEDAFVHRLKSTANDTNSTRTIEDIYNTILPYLTDILEDPILPQDDRPKYENQSSGSRYYYS